MWEFNHFWYPQLPLHDGTGRFVVICLGLSLYVHSVRMSHTRASLWKLHGLQTWRQWRGEHVE